MGESMRKMKINELQDVFRKNAKPKQSEMLVDRDPGERNAQHPSLGHRNKRVLAYERTVGKGAVVYIGLGHSECSLTAIGGRPGYLAMWTNPTFQHLIKNAIHWAAC